MTVYKIPAMSLIIEQLDSITGAFVKMLAIIISYDNQML